MTEPDRDLSHPDLARILEIAYDLDMDNELDRVTGMTPSDSAQRIIATFADPTSVRNAALTRVQQWLQRPDILLMLPEASLASTWIDGFAVGAALIQRNSNTD